MRLYYKNQQFNVNYCLGSDLLFTATVTRNTTAVCVIKRGVLYRHNLKNVLNGAPPVPATKPKRQQVKPVYPTWYIPTNEPFFNET